MDILTRLLTGAALGLILAASVAAPASAQDAPASEAPETDEPAAEIEEDDEAEGDGGTYRATGMFDYGFPGIMNRDNRTDLAPLRLASGQPVAGEEYTLKSGGYYRIELQGDGTQELSLSGGDFFRAIWIDEIVINDIEIRPMGVHSIEFDAEGSASMSFVAILPGRYTLSVPGSTGETLQAVFNIQ